LNFAQKFLIFFLTTAHKCSILKKRVVGNYFGKYHIFRDPIHGFIKVYDIERRIVDTSVFQRLRRIKQLGTTYLVYHGADHTRFAHSLGVMELADRVFNTIVEKDRIGDKIVEWTSDRVQVEKKRALIRLVALLHDIGHPAFSHVGEKDLFKPGVSHKHYSAKIIMGHPELRSVLESQEIKEMDITPDKLSDFILGRYPDPILQQIVDGPLDVDKMDYLWRDSYFTGVHYGRFDIDRLIHTLLIAELRQQPVLGIEEGGILAAEGLILARYYMFLQVYFHDIRRAYDFHLSDFLKLVLPEGRYPEDLQDYLVYDDFYVVHLLHEAMKGNDEKSEKAKPMVKRKHYKPIHYKELRNPITAKWEKEKFYENAEHLRNDSKFKDIDFRIDVASEAPNKFAEEGEDFIYKVEDESVPPRYKNINYKTDLLKNLGKFDILRLYCPDSPILEEIKSHLRTMQWE
jgi:HD superfamily phosphohydrolase